MFWGVLKRSHQFWVVLKQRGGVLKPHQGPMQYFLYTHRQYQNGLGSFASRTCLALSHFKDTKNMITCTKISLAIAQPLPNHEIPMTCTLKHMQNQTKILKENMATVSEARKKHARLGFCYSMELTSLVKTISCRLCREWRMLKQDSLQVALPAVAW